MSDYFMGTDGFVWFVGVVEDRDDPEYMGRVRVRCLGFHTENKSMLPTEDLPWATVMAPTTNPSMSGLGSTPPFLVEGSWVVGFFRDSREKQQPIILGSLPGFNAEAPDYLVGFSDPKGIYPTILGEPDTNRLAQGINATYHPSLFNRRANKLNCIPTATKPLMDTVPGSMYNDHGGQEVYKTATQSDVDAYPPGANFKNAKPPVGNGAGYLKKTDIGNPIDGCGHKPKVVSSTTPKLENRSSWSEPHPKSSGVSIYPFNHVHESESGHVQEVDDTPGNERLHRYHKAGTFEEIHPDGTRVTKIVKDDYEIVMNDKNVFIQGVCNLTVNGNVRQLVKGDYHLEVEGDYSQKIHKNFYQKVGVRGEEAGGGNLEQEIIGNHSYNIEASQSGRIHKDVDTTIDGKENRIVGKNATLFVTGDNDSNSPTYEQGYTIITSQDMLVSAAKKMSLVTTSGIIAIQAADKLNLKSASDMAIKSETKITETAITTINTTAGTIYTIQSGGGSPTATNKVDINP